MYHCTVSTSLSSFLKKRKGRNTYLVLLSPNLCVPAAAAATTATPQLQSIKLCIESPSYLHLLRRVPALPLHHSELLMLVKATHLYTTIYVMTNDNLCKQVIIILSHNKTKSTTCTCILRAILQFLVFKVLTLAKFHNFLNHSSQRMCAMGQNSNHQEMPTF